MKTTPTETLDDAAAPLADELVADKRGTALCPECLRFEPADARELHKVTMHMPEGACCPRCATVLIRGWQGMACSSCERQADETSGDLCMGTGHCHSPGCDCDSKLCHDCFPDD